MMKVRLKVERQTCGVPAQKPGDIIELADAEAERLIAAKQAEPVKKAKEG